MESPTRPPVHPVPPPAWLLGPWELVRVARLGLMASHLWLYFAPLLLARAEPDVTFWVGALYVTVPLGLVIYGWNDFYDADVDAISRRKASRVSRLFGYRLEPRKRRVLPIYIIAFQLPFIAVALAAGETFFLFWLAVMAFANWLYNGPGPRLSRVPVVAELVATWIYLNILWLSTTLTGSSQPLEVWLLAAGAILFFQVGGAIVDIRADRSVGKVTFAAWVGESWASRVLSALVAVKAAILVTAFSALLPAALNLIAVPFCLARPALGDYHWSGVAYANFVVIDWIALGLLAAGAAV